MPTSPAESSARQDYPEHLRPSLEAMPSSPGVYVFHGQEGDLPLYIGKSVNLRSRVLSHMRNPDESRMLRQARRISFIRTAGEIGALLLEAQMIKAQHPLFNQKLRRNRQLCSLRLPPEGPPEVVYSRDIDFATEPNLHSLYASKHAAVEGLRALADQHRLCHVALGLEKPVAGRGCFGHMLRRCDGVCCGRETPERHRDRVLTALEHLRVDCWPHSGALGLVERDPGTPDLVQIHVVRNWCYLGSVSRPEEATRLARVAADFDADGYKILCRPILTGSVELMPL